MSPRPRFENLDEEKKEQILEAAADEFGERGYESASINRIIDRAGISKGAAYYYFDDKSDLYVTTLNTALKKVASWLGFRLDDLQADNFWESLRDYSVRSIQFMRENAWASKLFRGFYAYADQHSSDRAIRALWKAVNAYTREFLERGQELGQVRTDMPMDLLIEITVGAGQAMDRWFLDRFDDMTDEDIDELGDMFLDVYKRLFKPTTSDSENP